jgi:hypothetical protein
MEITMVESKELLTIQHDWAIPSSWHLLLLDSHD